MKLAILKAIVYILGVILIGSIFFLGYAVFKKNQDPDWNPFKKNALEVAYIESQPKEKPEIAGDISLNWEEECILGSKNVIQGENHLIIESESCPFIQIFSLETKDQYRIYYGQERKERE